MVAGLKRLPKVRRPTQSRDLFRTPVVYVHEYQTSQNRFTVSAPRAAASLCSVGRPEGALTDKY